MLPDVTEDCRAKNVFLPVIVNYDISAVKILSKV